VAEAGSRLAEVAGSRLAEVAGSRLAETEGSRLAVVGSHHLGVVGSRRQEAEAAGILPVAAEGSPLAGAGADSPLEAAENRLEAAADLSWLLFYRALRWRATFSRRVFANLSHTCNAANGPKGRFRITNQTDTTTSAVIAAHRRCCQVRMSRPTIRP